MRILFLSHWFPCPPDNGSKLRILNLLQQLGRRHEVDLLTFGRAADVGNTAAYRTLRESCASVRVVPHRPFQPNSPHGLLGLFSPRPRSLAATYSDAMAAAVRDAADQRGVGLVMASQLAMAPYALEVPGVPGVLEELELSVFLNAMGQGSRLARVRARLTWLKLTSYLRSVLPRFAACTVVSELERSNARIAAPNYEHVAVVPNAVDLARYDGQFGAAVLDTLIFPGALTYSANEDAVRYFLATVYPHIRSAVPECTFRVSGSTAGVDLTALPLHPGVKYTGYVDDIRPLVAQSWVTVAPLRLGGGTRLKILESMALGTPVVSSSKGAEGLDVTDGDNILIADQPQEFGAKVVDVLRSPELRSRLAAGGRRLVESRYDWQVVGRDFLSLVERLRSINGDSRAPGNVAHGQPQYGSASGRGIR